MPRPRTPICVATSISLAFLALAAACRTLDAESDDREKAKNAGGNGTMYRESGAPRAR